MFPGPAIRALAVGATLNYTAGPGVQMYNEGNCDPAGLAFGPGTDIALGCAEGDKGAPLLVQIMDRTAGAIVASAHAGGGDQLEYDPATNRYYNAARNWTGTGLAGDTVEPSLIIIDAASRAVAARLPTGKNAHSVAVDPATHKAFVPVSSSASQPAGLLTFATQ